MSTDLTNWRGAQPPSRRDSLPGPRVTLEPVDPGRHAHDLYAAGHHPGDPKLWDYLPYGPFDDESAYVDWLNENAVGSDDPLFYAIVDNETGKAEGIATYLRITPDHGVIEIGHIWFGHALQRTPKATEAIYLLARNAFDVLGNRRLEWKCNAANDRSTGAARRFGFTYEGTFRQHLVVKGQNRDSAWFSILDGEWPRIKAGFEEWLAPENFDPETGQQLRPLSARSAP
jgi:RimJ/RimL family protein N-acetyltransferase